MHILFLSKLDAAETVVEFCAERTRLAVFRDYVRAVVLRVVDTLDRADYSRRSASASLFKRRKLIFRDLTAFHLDAHILGELHKALVGD